MNHHLPFFKYHGIGNDFVVLDGLSGPLPLEKLTSPEVARRLCHRHFGIGADGLLLVLPPSSQGAQARMRVINSDGSEAEMCGNGIRCVAKYLHDRRPELRALRTLGIDTGAGLLLCRLGQDPDGRVSRVKVDMGPARTDPVDLGMDRSAPLVDQEVSLDGHALRATAVSIGNPHLVFFLAQDQDPRSLALELGPGFERHPLFRNRTNVEMARPGADGATMELWVWERGCGLTMACGTGACATAAAAVLTGRHPAGAPLEVRLPGGPLVVEVAGDLSHVWLEGPVQEVFQGEVLL